MFARGPPKFRCGAGPAKQVNSCEIAKSMAFRGAGRVNRKRGKSAMKYVERVLQDGENIRYVSHIHWVVFLPGAAMLVIGVAGALALANVNPFPQDLPGLPSLVVLAIGGVYGVISLVGAWFRRLTVEVAATDRRIIFKHGFIRRHTIEMNMNKVESVDVDQSVLGRLFDYGSITVRGTGSTLEPLRMITSPLEFRSHVIAGEHA